MAYQPRKRAAIRKSFVIGKTRHSWLRGWLGEIITQYLPHDYNPDDDPEAEEDVTPEKALDEPGPTVKLWFRKNGRTFTLDLSGCTELELIYLRQILNDAIDLAFASAIERDREAAKAYAQGDDRYPRSYRTLPQLVVTPREGVSYPEGVQLRPEGTSFGADHDWNHSLGVIRERLDAMAAGESIHRESQDDRQTTDLGSSVRPLGPDGNY